MFLGCLLIVPAMSRRWPLSERNWERKPLPLRGKRDGPCPWSRSSITHSRWAARQVIISLAQSVVGLEESIGATVRKTAQSARRYALRDRAVQQMTRTVPQASTL